MYATGAEPCKVLASPESPDRRYRWGLSTVRGPLTFGVDNLLRTLALERCSRFRSRSVLHTAVTSLVDGAPAPLRGATRSPQGGTIPSVRCTHQPVNPLAESLGV